LQGEVVTLGLLAGDVEIDGGLKGGRIAAERGIPANLQINGGVDASSAVVSGGAIGDPAAGTGLSVGQALGIVAAEGSIILLKGTTTQAAFFQGNLLPGSPNGAAIDAIFTHDGGQPLAFDLTGLDLGGLNLILQDLEALQVRNGTLTGPIP
jgi:hypothetical protein